MDKQLEWEYYYNKKDNWKYDAFQRIKNQLLLVHDNEFVRFDSSAPKHLAVVYGKSQSGKTTLILTMIGIKQDPEIFQKVYNTLRAGIPKGNSSTSTAIIYSKSKNDSYGCAAFALNGSEDKITYFDNEEYLEDMLIKIRKEVEENKRPFDIILHIHIPKKYFDNNDDNIAILDMPGVGSKNTKEIGHVEALMNRYIPIASVCIVVWPPDEISSLKTDVILNKAHWTQMEHKYILVLVRAYSNQRILSLWKKSSLQTDFWGFVVNEYNKALKNELGEINKIEIYPIEVGESYNKLCGKKTEIKVARETALKSLKSAILNRNGDKLVTSLKNLQKKVEADSSAISNVIEKEKELCKKKIRTAEQNLEQTEKYQEIITKKIEKNNNYKKIEKLNTLKNEILNISVSTDNIYSIFTEEADRKEFKVHKNHGRKYYYRKFDDDNSDYGRVFELFREIVFSQCEIHVKQYEKWDYTFQSSEDSLAFKKTQNDPILSEISIKKSEIRYHILIETDKILNNCIDKLSPNKMLDHIYLDEIETCCDYVCVKLEQIFSKECKKIISKIERKIAAINKYSKRLQIRMTIIESNLFQYKSKIKDLEKDLSIIERDEQQYKENVEKDKATLALYRKHVNEAFEAQKRQIICSINLCTSSDERMMYLLLLGIIEKEYEEFNKICEVNDNE